jgi:hypothetical protein
MNFMSDLTHVGATQLVAFLIFSCTPPEEENKIAARLPPAVVAAWKGAGGQVGTMPLREDARLPMVVYINESCATPSHAGEIPAFAFHKWRNGATSKLPQPPSPFGLILFDFTDADLKDLAKLKNLQRVSFTLSSITGVGLRDLADLENLRSLAVIGTPINDAGIKELAQLKALRTLYLTANKNITETGLRELARLKRLEVLNVSSANMTDDILRRLTDLQEIRRLDISSNVTGAGLGELAGLKNLRWLGLAHTRITDSDLKAIAKLTGLEELEVGGNPVTDAGVAYLQKALPSLKIKRKPKNRTGP